MVSLKPVLVLMVVVGLLACKPGPTDYELKSARVESLKTTVKSSAELKTELQKLDFSSTMFPGKEYRTDAKLTMSDGPELMWPIVKNESFHLFTWREEEIPFPGIYGRRIVVMVQSSGNVITKFEIK